MAERTAAGSAGHHGLADYPARRVADLLPWNWQPGDTNRAAA